MGINKTKFGLTILAKIRLNVRIVKLLEYVIAINNKNPKTPLVVSAIVLVSITGDKLNAIKENNLIFSLITLLNCSIIFLSKKIHPKPTKNPSIAKIILEPNILIGNKNTNG